MQQFLQIVGALKTIEIIDNLSDFLKQFTKRAERLADRLQEIEDLLKRR